VHVDGLGHCSSSGCGVACPGGQADPGAGAGFRLDRRAGNDSALTESLAPSRGRALMCHVSDGSTIERPGKVGRCGSA
jgi:hypothetical protein